MSISGNQIKAARALAGLDQKGLAERANVGINTIRNMEAADAGNVRGRTDTLDAVVAALKSAGVIFVEANGEGPGVRLRKSIPSAPFTIKEFMRVIDEFERARFQDVREKLQNPELAAKLTLERHPQGVNLKVSGRGSPIGTIRLVEGTIVFEPELENGRDWTPHDWLTPNEMSRWVREAWQSFDRKGRA
jgi:transcriptional regulator with XRE-family HTH domain